MSRRPTIRDISIQAGVSTYSVSQALAGKPGVAEGTRERVIEIAAALGYLPNKLAANLKDSRTRTVGVLTASGRNQYYAMLVQAIDVVLQRTGYHAVTNDAMRGQRYRADIEREGVEELLQQRVAAVVATYSLAEESLELLQRWDVPVVFVDSPPPPSAAGYPFVGIDNYSASAEVANYLADIGHRRSLYLAFPTDWNTRKPRQAGFTEAAALRGMEVEVVDADNSAESAEAVIAEILRRDRQRWPTAIYATNILLLQGALKALSAARITVPDDISIIGFDDFDWAELLHPAMTVLDQHIAEIGATAGRVVLEVIDQRADGTLATPSEPVHIRTNIIERESCAPPRTTDQL